MNEPEKSASPCAASAPIIPAEDRAFVEALMARGVRFRLRPDGSAVARDPSRALDESDYPELRRLRDPLRALARLQAACAETWPDLVNALHDDKRWRAAPQHVVGRPETAPACYVCGLGTATLAPNGEPAHPWCVPAELRPRFRKLAIYCPKARRQAC